MNYNDVLTTMVANANGVDDKVALTILNNADNNKRQEDMSLEEHIKFITSPERFYPGIPSQYVESEQMMLYIFVSALQIGDELVEDERAFLIFKKEMARLMDETVRQHFFFRNNDFPHNIVHNVLINNFYARGLDVLEMVESFPILVKLMKTSNITYKYDFIEHIVLRDDTVDTIKRLLELSSKIGIGVSYSDESSYRIDSTGIFSMLFHRKMFKNEGEYNRKNIDCRRYNFYHPIAMKLRPNQDLKLIKDGVSTLLLAKVLGTDQENLVGAESIYDVLQHVSIDKLGEVLPSAFINVVINETYPKSGRIQYPLTNYKYTGGNWTDQALFSEDSSHNLVDAELPKMVEELIEDLF